MRLLIDSDAFCKLGSADLLAEGVSVLGFEMRDCERLPALRHMLRRGKLRHAYGDDTCEALVRLADSVRVVEGADSRWLDLLTPETEIDPGEALLLAAAAESGGMILTGDIRAMNKLKRIDQFVAALEGRIVLLEAILLLLCEKLGAGEMTRRVEPLVSRDRVVGVCFSRGSADPKEGLRSYLDSRIVELAPLELWDPRQESTG